MASPTRGQIFFSDKVADALVAYLIKSYKSVSSKTLGRTILQKLCYFAEASGVPLPFRFEIYHYGPFSQEIFDRAESLLLDSVIEDRSNDPGRSDYVPGPNLDLFLDCFGDAIREHEANLQRVATMFSRLDPSQMELVSTIHYMHSSHHEWFKEAPSKEVVVSSVLQVKGEKFSRETVDRVYDMLREAKLLSRRLSS
jgi:uncharacterized protein YwgA